MFGIVISGIIGGSIAYALDANKKYNETKEFEKLYGLLNNNPLIKNIKKQGSKISFQINDIIYNFISYFSHGSIILIYNKKSITFKNYNEFFNYLKNLSY